MMEFLYFPQDKSEYIPSVITLLLFSVTAILVMRFIVKYSKKEQARAESQYEELRHQDDVQSEHRSSSDS